MSIVFVYMCLDIAVDIVFSIDSELTLFLPCIQHLLLLMKAVWRTNEDDGDAAEVGDVKYNKETTNDKDNDLLLLMLWLSSLKNLMFVFGKSFIIAVMWEKKNS